MQEESQKPVRYFNGELQIAEDDLNAGGGGTPWGHRRSYSNRMAYDYDYGNGFNWLVREWPYLATTGNQSSSSSSSSSSSRSSSSSSSSSGGLPQTIAVVRTSQSPVWFDLVDGTYVGRYGILDILTYDPGNAEFVLTSKLGNVTKFQEIGRAHV